MLETELGASRIFSPFREEIGDEELSVLPRHTKVIVTGNNRTKSVLLGLQGVVKKAVGLGGWHWLVLKNGVEVKLQRNALSVLEHPTGNEIDEEDLDLSSSGSEIGEKDHDSSGCVELRRPSKPSVKQAKSWLTSSTGKANRSIYRDVQSIIHAPRARLNFAKLAANSLRRYCRHFGIVGISSDSSREQMVKAVQHHFTSQPPLKEERVIAEFVSAAAKRRKTAVDPYTD